MNYDRRFDLLMLTITDPPPGISDVNLDEHVIVRIDPATNRVIGLEIESLIDFVLAHPEWRHSFYPLDKRQVVEILLRHARDVMKLAEPVVAPVVS
ncbi:MAG: hypothetical protein U0531_21220 [Dehalococcoidia bacterium]